LLTNIAGEADTKVVKDLHSRTFGKSPGSLQPDPQIFLKRCARSSSVPSLTRIKKEQPELLQPSKLKVKTRPPVPKDEKPIMNLVSSKNFIVANAVETILAAPKKTGSGAKDFLHKEDYGKVPRYLKNIKHDIAAEYDYIRELQESENANSDAARLMTEEEKHGLIEGLKSKWEAVNHNYQGGTHMTKLDTMGKIRRKETYEAQLSQIEKDIEKINKRQIYIDPSQ